MGIYMSSTLKCLECGNENTFDTSAFFAPPPLDYLIEKRPRIICDRCKGEKIKASDHRFFSFDMTMNNDESLWEVKTPEEIWIMPDNKQRLSDVIWIDVKYYFQYDEGNICNMLLNFSEFDRFTERENGTDVRPVVPFKRVKHLSEVQDMYVGLDDEYRTHLFCPYYSERFSEDKPAISDYEDNLDYSIPRDFDFSYEFF